MIRTSLRISGMMCGAHISGVICAAFPVEKAAFPMQKAKPSSFRQCRWIQKS